MDGYGQDDGEFGAAVGGPYAASMRAQPWMRGGMPPWHMWGNTQTLRVSSADWGEATELANQLIKINYKRPEAWHWVFKAVPRFPASPGGGQVGSVRVHWDLTFGHGRSNITIRSFEVYQWQWVGAGPTQEIYSSQVFGPNRFINDFDPPPTPRENLIEQIVAQDIQLQVRMDLTNNTIANQTFELEVSAYFSPKVHVRPDWLQIDAPPEAQFPGEEVQGR